MAKNSKIPSKTGGDNDRASAYREWVEWPATLTEEMHNR